MGLGQTLRTGRPLVGELSFHDRLGVAVKFIGTHADRRELKPRVCETPPPMQAWSLALGINQRVVTRTPVWEAAKDPTENTTFMNTTLATRSVTDMGQIEHGSPPRGCTPQSQSSKFFKC